MQGKEKANKESAGINIDIRKTPVDACYLDMDHLADIVDKPKNGDNQEVTLRKRAKEYKPIRDAVMHTSLITPEAKSRLSTIHDDIKARLKKLF